MGWDFGPMRGGAKTAVDAVRHELTWSGQEGSGECLAAVMVGSVCYSAVKIHKPASGASYVIAFVTLTEGTPAYFGTKHMDEGMGPFYYDCPREVLDLLTDPPAGHSTDWREACRAKLSENA